jgi:uncharacterized protein YegL
MGWASYREDIVSRFGSDLRLRPERHRQVASRQHSDGVSRRRDRPMEKFKDFVLSEPRPLPVILLLDTSGSMKPDGKIDALNEAAANMTTVFSAEDNARAELHVAVVTFGAGGAKIHRPLQSASTSTWSPLKAHGHTPLGEALDLTRSIIEDRAQISSRAYRPAIILVSDGQPTDESGRPTDKWRSSLEQLLSSERASKADRFAMAIGDDADLEVLSAFLADPQARIFHAHEARQIKEFFRWVTMSVTARSRSANPNDTTMLEPTDLEDLEFD